MLKADRQSLIDEINSLHQRLLEANSQLQENQDQVRQQVVRLEEVKSSTEWKLQRQSRCCLAGHEILCGLLMH